MGRRRDKLPTPQPQRNEEWSPVRIGDCSLPSGPILPAGSIMGMPHSSNLGPPLIQNLYDDVSQHNFLPLHHHPHGEAGRHGYSYGQVSGTSFQHPMNDYGQYRPFEHLCLDPPPPRTSYCNVNEFVRHQIRNYYIAHNPTLVHPPPHPPPQPPPHPPPHPPLHPLPRPPHQQHRFTLPQLPTGMGQGYVHHHHHDNVSVLGHYHHPFAFSGNLPGYSQRPLMDSGEESRRSVGMQSLREPTLEITDDTRLSQILASMEDADPEPPFFSRDGISPRSHFPDYDAIDWSFELEAWRNRRSTEIDIFDRPPNPIASTLDSLSSSFHPSRETVTRGSYHARRATPSVRRDGMNSSPTRSDAADCLIAPIPIPADLARPLVLPSSSRDPSASNPSSSFANSSSSLPPRSSSPFIPRHRIPPHSSHTPRHLHVPLSTDDRRFVPSGYTCVLCMHDLAHPPEGPVNMHSNPPPVAILPCHHYYHADCLEQITPAIDAANPPCIICSLPE